MPDRLLLEGGADALVQESSAGNLYLEYGYSAVILSDSPVAYWRLNDAAGPTISPIVGPSLTASNSPTFGATGLTGDGDPAVDFLASSTEYALGNDAGMPTGNSPWTLEAWVKTSTSGEMVVLGYGTAGSSRDAHMGLFNGGLVYDTSSFFNNFGGTVDNGVAHVIALTWDGTTMKGYVDGSQVGSGFTPGALNLTPSGSGLSLGSRGGGIYFFNGTIDEAAIYPSALTSTRLLAHYNARTTTTDATASPSRATVTYTARTAVGSGSITGSPARVVVTATSTWCAVAGRWLCFDHHAVIN
jgi:hypothetical protein